MTPQSLVTCLYCEWLGVSQLLDRPYLQWYSNAGPFVAIATAAFGAAWGGLDKNPALVSANPLAYFGACLQVAGLPLVAAGAHLKSQNRIKPVGWEIFPVFLLIFALVPAIVAWLLFIVPAQFFLFLIAGSLSRLALTSTARISSHMGSSQVTLVENGDQIQHQEKDGWWDASMRTKPVALASAFGATLLFLLGLGME